MDLRLKGRHCVVLGGSSGIGRSIALGLAAEGANVAICARGEEALRRTEAELCESGANVYAASCDIGEPAALRSYLQSARQHLGGLDILVHNASALAIGPDLADWEASLRVDLMAAVHACDEVIPWMQEQGGGSILLVSSISGLECDPAPNYAYASAKAALIAYAKKLAVMHAGAGIRVNALAPGSTEFQGGLWEQFKETETEMYETVRAQVPSGRLGTPEEVADVAVFLVSPRANWLTGECVSVDGAQHKGMR